MKSKRRQLEDDVLAAADQWLTATSGLWPHTTETVKAEQALRESTLALRGHLEQINDDPGAFVPGSPTSEAAARSLAPGTIRRRVLDEIRSAHGAMVDGAFVRGLTDDELERRLVRSHQTVSSARNWLVHAGWLCDSGFTRKTRSNRDAVVWTLTNRGAIAMASPEWIERKS
jgi:hypothetical protein